MELPFLSYSGEMLRSFSIKLHSETQVSGRLGMSGGRSSRHAQNPLSGERRKTLSITHHALSPPPSHQYLYMIYIINRVRSQTANRKNTRCLMFAQQIRDIKPMLGQCWADVADDGPTLSQNWFIVPVGIELIIDLVSPPQMPVPLKHLNSAGRIHHFSTC